MFLPKPSDLKPSYLPLNIQVSKDLDSMIIIRSGRNRPWKYFMIPILLWKWVHCVAGLDWCKNCWMPNILHSR